MAPKKAFTGEKSDVSHVKLFGSLVYIHVLEEKRMELEPSNMTGILVDYSESSKA
jgi:hypothetical protein